MKGIQRILTAFAVLAALTYSEAQAQSSPNFEISVVNTAVPFLRIAPDARAGGMGDVGVATRPDAYSMFHNPSKMAFGDENLALAISYTPWLRALVNDIYLASLSGYKKIDKVQTIGLSLRYFSLGNIVFTNDQAQVTGEFRPNEFALDAGYARKLSDNFSAGIALRFIYSNLATGQTVAGINIKPGIAAAGDISFFYNNNKIKVGDRDAEISAGINLSNIGSKITYTESAQKDFIPMNMGLGTAFAVNFDEFNKLGIALDLNKLMVPSPCNGPDEECDTDNNGIADYKEKSVPGGLFGSFADAENGFSEEMQEIMLSVGLEYWYNNMFAVRTGYFYEHANKGNRKFFTAGLGVKYSVFGLDFSYLVPTSAQRNPLDNTLRFTLRFDFEEFKNQKEVEQEESENIFGG